MTRKNIAYLDCASTTPVRSEVLRTMKPFFSDDFGNPANLDSLGHRARLAVENSLKNISSVLNCRPDEFVFTGSATEADNLAIIGTARANREHGNRIIVSNLEHKGILAACAALKKDGFEIIHIQAGKDGLISPKEMEDLIDKKTILVSITTADSETGTIQPIAELAKAVKLKTENRRLKTIFHTDASQAAGYLDLDVKKSGVDLMTLSAHKIYGPKGIGGLYIRKGVAVAPIIHGGGQQGRVRSGTENVPAIVGFGEALRLVATERTGECRRIAKLRDTLQKGVYHKIGKVILNGNSKKRLPNFLNVSFLDVEGEALLLRLDDRGIIVNTGSACNSQTLEPSAVLSALGRPYELIHGSIRFTLGKYTTPAHISKALKILPGIVADLRKISPLNLELNKINKISEPKAFLGNNLPHFLKNNLKK